MVATTRRSTRTTKETLFGPLPPPTRRRPGPSILERRRKLDFRRLSKLPSLPPTPHQHHLLNQTIVQDLISTH
ncbi:hypothetical protein H4Q26_010198 [Puccinia striiformis f. sp. tritici PST-130]|nr:hypothetical protein H4Q26_010198 [Puccinia striiformis f. sp. tritici PST-130]